MLTVDICLLSNDYDFFSFWQWCLLLKSLIVQIISFQQHIFWNFFFYQRTFSKASDTNGKSFSFDDRDYIGTCKSDVTEKGGVETDDIKHAVNKIYCKHRIFIMTG